MLLFFITIRHLSIKVKGKIKSIPIHTFFSYKDSTFTTIFSIINVCIKLNTIYITFNYFSKW